MIAEEGGDPVLAAVFEVRIGLRAKGEEAKITLANSEIYKTTIRLFKIKECKLV